MQTILKNKNIKSLWDLMENVYDPEIPVLSVNDLGIVRNIRLHDDDEVEVIITPTYSGCPAVDFIATNIRMELLNHGYTKIKITEQLSPAWTTDWMSEAGKEKLRAYGIAPPVGKNLDKINFESAVVSCPRCRSTNTELISQFGSTACKALFRCKDCLEPFDYFKCH
jgi:ring-1,2-phenylacetyl-CoA epoxidase subunit PaaD